MRAVAEGRFADAECLLDSRRQERANGAIYLAGFVIEILLKALLLERRPNLQGPVNPATLSTQDKIAFDLINRSHDLDRMYVFMQSEIDKKLSEFRTRGGRSALDAFKAICEEWTVFARYSSALGNLEDARRYVDDIREVKKWLKEL